MSDPFHLLDLEPVFSLSMEALEGAYLKKMAQTHPDHFVKQSLLNVQAAQAYAAKVNHAYAELKNPVIRAMWVLKCQGYWPPFESAEILEEIMVLQENFTPDSWHHQYQKAYHTFEEACATQNWPQAQATYTKFSYLAKLTPHS